MKEKTVFSTSVKASLSHSHTQILEITHPLVGVLASLLIESLKILCHHIKADSVGPSVQAQLVIQIGVFHVMTGVKCGGHKKVFDPSSGHKMTLAFIQWTKEVFWANISVGSNHHPKHRCGKCCKGYNTARSPLLICLLLR